MLNADLEIQPKLIRQEYDACTLEDAQRCSLGGRSAVKIPFVLVFLGGFERNSLLLPTIISKTSHTQGAVTLHSIIKGFPLSSHPELVSDFLLRSRT